MLIRKILKQLEEWKARPNRKPLLLRGARQVGKSTIVAEFGKQFENFISLNLEKSAHAKFFTDYGDNVNNIINALGLEFNIDLNNSNALLFIDEIQEQPQAIALLRYFYEDLPNLAVISAGSLLEFALGEVSSFPVGRVEQLPVYPLDFEEFLMALNEERALEIYNSLPIPDFAHDKLLDLFNTYILIGGMPEVVNEYVQNKGQLQPLNRIYASIWDNYRDDIEKYGQNTNEKRVLNHILTTAPMVRDRITFNGFGASQYSSKEVAEGFRKLHKAGIIKLIYPTTDINAPFWANLKRKPKIQFLDTGLLNYAANIQQELLTIKDFNSLYKGYIVNHIVFQELICLNNKIHGVPFFWTRESTTANAEIDAVIQYKNMIIPLEVKSGAKGSLKSLHEFMDRCDHNYAFRLLANKFKIEKSNTRSGKEFILVNLPYYCIGNIEKWISYIIENQGTK
jgi:uncharacterized protein